MSSYQSKNIRNCTILFQCCSLEEIQLMIATTLAYGSLTYYLPRKQHNWHPCFVARHNLEAPILSIPPRSSMTMRMRRIRRRRVITGIRQRSNRRWSRRRNHWGGSLRWQYSQYSSISAKQETQIDGMWVPDPFAHFLPHRYHRRYRILLLFHWYFWYCCYCCCYCYCCPGLEKRRMEDRREVPRPVDSRNLWQNWPTILHPRHPW